MIPHLHEKKTAYEMFKVILNLYHGSSDAKKLRSIQMSKGESIITYLSEFTQVRDDLGGVDESVVEKYLVSLALLGLHKSWYSFQDAVSDRENFPK